MSDEKHPHPEAKLTSIRLPAFLWESAQEEAKLHGISGAEYVREAVQHRLGSQFQKDIDDDPVVERLEHLQQELEREREREDRARFRERRGGIQR